MQKFFSKDGTILYSVRVSNRAKTPRIQMTPSKGVEVIVPKGFATSRIPALVTSRVDWIKKTAQRLTAQQNLFARQPLFPDSVEFPAISRSFVTSFIQSPSPALQTKGKTVHIYAPETLQGVAILQEWLKKYGGQVLPEIVHSLAQKTDLHPKKVQVRMQKKRWGSCSSRGTISLNARVLLLPQPLMHYVILHELAHLRHMNHSVLFWTFLQKLLPKALPLDQQLRETWKHLPRWAAMG